MKDEIESLTERTSELSEKQIGWTTQDYRIQALEFALRIEMSRVDTNALIASAKLIYEFIVM